MTPIAAPYCDIYPQALSLAIFSPFDPLGLARSKLSTDVHNSVDYFMKTPVDLAGGTFSEM